jgi:hypothetical protein
MDNAVGLDHVARPQSVIVLHPTIHRLKTEDRVFSCSEVKILELMESFLYAAGFSA